eukprot:EG_transcript_15851
MTVSPNVRLCSKTVCSTSFAFLGSSGSTDVPHFSATIVHDPYSFEGFSEVPVSSPTPKKGDAGEPTPPVPMPSAAAPACVSPLCQPAFAFHVSSCPAAFVFPAIPTSAGEPPRPAFPSCPSVSPGLDAPPAALKGAHDASPGRNSPPTPNSLEVTNARRERRKPQRPISSKLLLPPAITVMWKRYGTPVTPLEALQQLQRYRDQS